ncbi:MAG TPA: NAD(P)-dependent oxidoreductase [Candidatus Sulfotelmatobacter sp.]|jgi:nucleoside-diphosphate-sugar epimerase
MQLKEKRALVTGSSGVIGRVLLEKLVHLGVEVLGIDLVPPSQSIDRCRYITADLSAGVPDAAFDFAPELVFHLAASFERTVETAGYWKTVFKNDVLASHRLLEAVEPLKSLQVFVFASSYLNYDPSLYLDVPHVRKLKESDCLLPRNMVGLAKYYMDRELEFVQSTQANFRTVSARIYRVYGRGSRDVISRWVRSSLAGEELKVFGTNNRFDYIFADDVAEGLIRLSETENAVGPVNLGSGVSRSIEDVLGILSKETGGARIKREPYDGPIESSAADMSLFQRLTGWIPSTSLELGIRKIAEYEKQLHGPLAAR